MKKTIFISLVVIYAASAFGEPNYPPAGPEWLWNIRAISYGWAGGTGGILGKTPQEYAADANAIAANGYNTVVLFGRQDRLGSIQEWPAIVTELNELVTIFHQHGLRVFDHQSCGIVEANDINVPIPDTNSTIRDLLQIDAQTGQPVYDADWNIYKVCHINPLTQTLIQTHNQNLFTQTALDGLMSDDIGFAEYSCVCPYCRARCIRDLGFDVNEYIPPRDPEIDPFWFKPDNVNYRNWNRFHQNSVGDHYVRMRQLLDGIRPGLGLMACLSVTIEPAFSQYCGVSLEQIGRGANLLMHEDFSPAYVMEWQADASEILRAESLGRISSRPVLNLQYASVSRNELYSGATPGEVLFTWAMDRTLGCREWVNQGPATIGRSILWEAQHQELFDKPTIPANIAILYSTQSRDWLRPLRLYIQPEEQLTADYRGWCETLLFKNIPFHSIIEDQLTPAGLSSYRILIMPSVSCLSAGQCENISNWVAAGGTLIATEDCAMYNEIGEALSQSGLSGTLGVKIGKKIHCQTPVQVPNEDVFVNCGGQIDEPNRTRFECTADSNTLSFGSIEAGSSHPAMVRHKFGDGNSVYLAFRLGSAAWSRTRNCDAVNCPDPNNQYIRLGPKTPSTLNVIRNLIEPAVSQLPFTVRNAPRGLIITLHKSADNKQILHLLNATGSVIEPNRQPHIINKHSYQFPLILQDIQVTLREPIRLPVVARLPSGYDMVLDANQNTNTIIIPGCAIAPYTVIEIGGFPSADLNRDGIVNFKDFAIFAEQWL